MPLNGGMELMAHLDFARQQQASSTTSNLVVRVDTVTTAGYGGTNYFPINSTTVNSRYALGITSLQWTLESYIGLPYTAQNRARINAEIRAVVGRQAERAPPFPLVAHAVATERDQQGVAPRRPFTEAQRLAAERESSQWAERDRQLKENMAKARARARKLLVSHLSPDQRKTLEAHRYFDVEVGHRTYRIRQGTHGNVRLLEGGREIVSYCIQPNGVPDEDAMLAQKLTLECDEATFLRVANATRMAA